MNSGRSRLSFSLSLLLSDVRCRPAPNTYCPLPLLIFSLLFSVVGEGKTSYFIHTSLPVHTWARHFGSAECRIVIKEDTKEKV